MPGYVGFQLALELSNIFPLKELVTSTGPQLLRLARNLRKSGSDLLVEQDLAAVFGRGRIEPQLEQDFKKTVNIQKFIPVKDGAEIVLQSGIGRVMLKCCEAQCTCCGCAVSRWEAKFSSSHAGAMDQTNHLVDWQVNVAIIDRLAGRILLDNCWPCI